MANHDLQNFDRTLFQQILSYSLNVRLNYFMGKHEMISMFGATSLGSLWQPISLGVTVFGIGVIFGQLFNLPLDRYLPFLCIGMIQWQFLVNVFNDMSGVFANGSAHKDTRYDELIIFPLRIWSKQIFQMCFNVIILFVVALYFKLALSFVQLMISITGLVIFSYITLYCGLLFCLVGAFYKDFANIVKNIFGLLFFVTPVMWQPSSLKYSYVFDFNPIYHLIEIVRRPILDYSHFEFAHLLYAFATLIIIALLSIACWTRNCWKIPYHY